jgi:hypothetical protein
MGLVGASSLGGIAGQDARAAPAMQEAVLPDIPPRDPPVGRVWVSPPNCYFAYPDHNGFLPDGNPVIAQIGEDGHTLTYLEWNFRSGETRPIFRTTTYNIYWDIAEHTDDLVAMQNRGSIVAVTTHGTPKPETILHVSAAPSARLEDLVSINAAGDKVLYAVEKSDNDPKHIRASELFELDAAPEPRPLSARCRLTPTTSITAPMMKPGLALRTKGTSENHPIGSGR